MAYIPAQPPTDPTAIPAYLKSELQKMALNLASQQPAVRYAQQAVLPAKPREGDTAYFAANVTAPSTAAGLYQYRSGAWVRLA
jgi:hypothetical protein